MVDHFVNLYYTECSLQRTVCLLNQMKLVYLPGIYRRYMYHTFHTVQCNLLICPISNLNRNDMPIWCHDMETLPALLVLCEENPLVTNGFPSWRGSNAGLSCFIRRNAENIIERRILPLIVWFALTLAWRHWSDISAVFYTSAAHLTSYLVTFVHGSGARFDIVLIIYALGNWVFKCQ